MAKSLIILAIIASLLGGLLVVWKQSAAKDVEIAALHQNDSELETLRGEHEELLKLRARPGLASLVTDTTPEAVKLRGEVATLRDENNRLKQQLAVTAQASASLQTVQTQQTALVKEALAELQQAREAASTLTQKDACNSNLHRIDAAKQQWASETKQTVDASPTWQDLMPYLAAAPTGGVPVCPAGGTYTIGRMSEMPSCSAPGHTIH